MLALALFLSICVSSAQGAFKFAGGGGVTATDTTVGSAHASGLGGWAAGAELEWAPRPWIGLSLGGGYFQRAVVSESASITMGCLVLPLQARLWAWQVLGAGLGGYYSKVLGSARAQVGSATTSLSVTEAGLEASDLGLSASGFLQLPLGKALGIYLEGRVLWGLLDASAITGVKVRFREQQALAGLRLCLGC